MNKTVSALLKLTLVILLMNSVSGCQTVGKTLNLDTDLSLTIKSNANINPDDSAKPSPLFVRFYQLKSKDLFENANFIDLYESDQEMFGGDIISKKELKRLTPGEVRNENFVLDSDTQYIALFAEFFKYDESKYMIIVPIQTNNVFRDKIEINIASNSMTLVNKKRTKNKHK